MRVITCDTCGHAMTIGHGACRKCRSRRLTHYDLNLPADSIDYHKRVEQLAQLGKKNYISQTASMAIVGLVITAIVGGAFYFSTADETSPPKKVLIGLQKSVNWQ